MVLDGGVDRALRLGERALGGLRGVGEWTAEGGDEEVVGRLVEPERARLAGAADHAAGGAGEALEVLALAAARAGGELRREAGRQQQLEAKGERVGAAGPVGLRVEQRELVGEQVVDALMRVAVVEQAGDRVAGAGSGVDRRAVLPELSVAGQRLGARDRQEVAPPLVEHELEAEERLQPAAEARLGAADALGDRAHPPAVRGIEVEDPVGLAVAHGAQDDALGLQRARQRVPPILIEVMRRMTVYTTEPCGYCRTAKALLAKRGISYEEINLARDPEGRAELVRLTGMMTFPQVVIDGAPLGGYQELVRADRDGVLEDLQAAA
jgi:glutaredoxin 3